MPKYEIKLLLISSDTDDTIDHDSISLGELSDESAAGETFNRIFSSIQKQLI